jgi:VWFA-related protein
MIESIVKRLVWYLSIAVVLPLNVSSQTPSTAISQSSSNGQFTLKTATEVVLVNVTARDKNDNFIKDLKAEDFTILEDGRRQQIISLDVENTDSAVTTEPPRTPLLGNLDPASRASAPTRPAPVQDNDLKDRRLIVLFFDLSSMQPEEIERAAKSALNYADKQMAPADLVSVVTLSTTLKVDLDFTSDKEALTSLMTRFTTGVGEGFANGATPDANADATDNTDAAAAFTPDETEYNIFNTDRRLQALANLANDLSTVPQRKSVIYFSGGMQRTGVENQTQLRTAINAATRANLSFYTVDVRGLEAVIPGGAAAGAGGGRGGPARGGVGGGSSVYSGRGVLSQYDTNFGSQETLVTLANDTGGRAFLDTNDFAPAFTKVHEDTSFYYLLGYISTNAQKDGRYRRITVRLNRPDLRDPKLDFRKGYYAAADFQHATKESREQQLQEQLTSDVPTSDFPVYVSTGYFRLADNRYFVPISVVVPGSQIPFTRASEQDRATLDLLAVMRDEGKRPFGTIRDTVKLAVNTSQEVQRKNVQYDAAFLLPPGKYTVKFVVRENQTGRVGSFEAVVNVPDLKAAPVKVSSVILSNQKQPAKQKNHPLVREGSEIVPNVTHVFSSGQHLYFYYEVYDPAKPDNTAEKTAARVLTNVAFYKGAVKAYETPLVEADQVNVPERKATAFELDVPLGELKPGFYTCQINIVDDAAGKFVFPRLALLVR